MANKASITSEKFAATLDVRGFLRLVAPTARDIKAGKFPFVELFVDPVGKRIALKLSKKEKPGCFRLLDHSGRYLTYIQGALHAANLEGLAVGTVDLLPAADLLVLAPTKTKKSGPWIPFHCRNSANIPLASLDRRGTLILDRNCTKAIDMVANPTVDATYDAKRKTFTLTFSKKGALRVRPIANHANVSFMGTLGRNSLSLPEQHGRLVCTIKGNKISFSVADLLHSIR